MWEACTGRESSEYPKRQRVAGVRLWMGDPIGWAIPSVPPQHESLHPMQRRVSRMPDARHSTRSRTKWRREADGVNGGAMIILRAAVTQGTLVSRGHHGMLWRMARSCASTCCVSGPTALIGPVQLEWYGTTPCTNACTKDDQGHAMKG